MRYLILLSTVASFCSLVLLGCYSPSMATPPIVSDRDLSVQSVYHIRTRIVIEYINFSVKELGIQGHITAIKFSALKEEVMYAQEVYKNIGIKLAVEEITFKPFNPDFSKHEKDAEKHSDTMSIYYMLPNTFPVAGIGTTPWMTGKRGIFIASDHDASTLAHEIGHYFGLLHTFEKDDYCKDTEPQTNMYCTIPFLDPNCGNIMNYCSHNPKKLTAEQEDRVRRFLRFSRSDHIVQPDIKEMSADELIIIGSVFPIEITDQYNEPCY